VPTEVKKGKGWNLPLQLSPEPNTRSASSKPPLSIALKSVATFQSSPIPQRDTGTLLKENMRLAQYIRSELPTPLPRSGILRIGERLTGSNCPAQGTESQTCPIPSQLQNPNEEKKTNEKMKK